MLTSELHYELPPERIAQAPADKRDESRLLVYHRDTGDTSHHRFRELPELLPAGTRIFRNDVSVLNARLPGQRPTGGKVECLLLRPDANRPDTWRCLLKPGAKTAKAGAFSLAGEYEATVLEALPSGEYLVSVEHPNDPDVPALAGRIGTLPLPPYVKRPANAADAERYQTVYADDAKCTAVAAPTAGLHFTPELLEQLERRGHPMHDLTLSVGLGTFRPIETERVEDHPMHAETYLLPPAAKAYLREPRPPRLAVGTTTVRAIEHHLAQGEDAEPEASTLAEADLFIRPPYSFRGVDALLTNFHLPGSTLLCLVAAFLQTDGNDGLDLLKDLYAQALDNDYRFYSYGDAMLAL
jgi:S-adenosylmethionine:tRNA ribosyltransferase-isomerase